MRLLMEVLIPVARGNAAAVDGSMATAIKTFMDSAKPEAAYFHLRDGMRAATFIFDESNPANLVTHNEALFAALDAEISIQPVLTLEELKSRL